MRLIITFNNKNWPLPEPWTPPTPPGPANDEIWYTSTNGNILTPITSVLPTIVSNTYVDGKGIIKFATELTSIRGFNNSTLTSIEIPNSVTTIDSTAFYGCSSLTKANIPDRVTSIAYNAFDGCSKLDGELVIPNSVTSIGNYAFWGCSSLTSLTIGNSVTSIGGLAFFGCRGVTSISYTGTIAQYNAITKGENWHQGVPATVVHCTDGDTPI